MLRKHPANPITTPVQSLAMPPGVRTGTSYGPGPTANGLDLTQFQPASPAPHISFGDHEREREGEHTGNKAVLSRLPRDRHGSSLSSLAVPGARNRCLSEANMATLSKRTLSASNLMALSQGNLQLKPALSARSYNDPNSLSAVSKQQFEAKVRKYLHQLTVGCGAIGCRNKFCSSCPDGAKLAPDVAAIMAIQLASRTKTYLCRGMRHVDDVDVDSSVFISEPTPAETQGSRPFLHLVFSATPFATLFKRSVAGAAQAQGADGSTSPVPSLRGVRSFRRAKSSNDVRVSTTIAEERPDTDEAGTEPAAAPPADEGLPDEEIAGIEGLSLAYLTLPLLEDAIRTYRETGDDAFVLNTIRTVFSSSDMLSESFKRTPSACSTTYDSGLDLDSIRKSYEIILALEPHDKFQTTLFNALEIIIAHLANTSVPTSSLAQLLIILEFPELNVPTYHETMVRGLCKIISELPMSSVRLLRCWLSRVPEDHFHQFVEIFSQYVSVHHHPNQRPDQHLINALRSLHVLFEANELACRDLERHVVDPSLFYNDSVSRKIDFKEEYQIWKRSHSKNDKDVISSRLSLLPKVSFFDYPFIFDPASKSRILHIDAVVQMSQMFEDAFVHSAWVFQAQKILEDSSKNVDVKGVLKSATCPYLVLEVRREHLMQDTLAQLRSRKTQDLKKPLKIKYVESGEEGLDMGGVQKEFFQTIVERIFDPEVGMFEYNDDTRQFYVNPLSLESQHEFELAGLLLGLAIYNGVILDVKLPLTLYKKLLGWEPTLGDLKLAYPRLGQSLQQLLDWTDEQGSVEDIFCYTFQITQKVYGNIRAVDLKPNGGDIPVTNQNKAEFVKLYVDWILNKSIKRQFEAFSHGFHRVCGGPALSLCTPEELELLICGSPDLDFEALHKTATYDDGYHPDHPLIREFWEIVRQMDNENKKKLLNFVTGSDRVPINGLANMTFVIQRNGPDSDRLPTALTCFSRLLLPEYSSGEKLKERLITAIENGKGFGLV